MVECASDALRDQIVADAQNLIQNSVGIPVVAEDAPTKRRVHYEMRGDDPLLVHFLTVADLELD